MLSSICRRVDSCGSNTRLGEARYAPRRRTPAQVMPPGQREADRVECQVDFQRELRTTGDGDRLAEAARDQIAAARADRADESKRSPALDAGGLQGEARARLRRSPALPEVSP